MLVLRALGLGDFLAGVPALRALRRAVPDAEVVLAAPAAVAPLVDLAGVADLVLDTAGPVTPSWQGGPPDLAVDLHGRGPRSHRALLALEPARLLAFDCPEVGHHGPRWRADEHERARWCRLVADGLGVAADPDDVHLRPPDRPSPAPDAVVLHPGAGAPARQWPVDRFAAVARHLRDAGHRVVLTGSADERAVAGDVACLAGLGQHAVLAGRTDLAELAALVSGALLVVSGDTGIAHLASAYAVPSVVLFGPVPPGEWGPPTDGPHTVLWSARGPESERGDPHADTVDPGLEAIAVDDVLRAVQARLARVGAGTRGQTRSNDIVSPRDTGVTTSARPAVRAASRNAGRGDLKTP